MDFYLPPGGRRISLDVRPSLHRAREALPQKPESLADEIAPRSDGGRREYYSEGDYWWPDPARLEGVPYTKRDGALNPDAFQGHRLLLRRMVERVGALAVAYRVTRNGVYRSKAETLLETFFLDPERGMIPRLSRAQAIPGVCPGRGIGIIDGIHLIDVLPAMDALCLEQPRRINTGYQLYRLMEDWFAGTSQ